MQPIHRFLAFLLLVSIPGLAAAGDWPHLRGPNFDGRIPSAEVFDGDHLGLQLSWKAPLGSGYSGIVLSGGRAVTLFSDGRFDYVIAFGAENGEELWRHKIDGTNKGHDGSNDGPLSSPVISDGAVYGLGPKGQFFALRLTDGTEIWSKALDRDFGSKAPVYGFTTTPIVEGNVLVVQTGGSEGRAICGLDKKTGERLWSFGDEDVAYQSPAVMTLAGRRQIVAVSGKRIAGLVPDSGKLLWAYQLGEGDDTDSANPTFAGDDRFLILVEETAIVFRVTKTQDGYQAKELYRSKELGNTYAAPVYHEDHLYGFRRQFLTCVNAETGERVWRSRPPGGRGLILVNGHLVIFGAKGTVVVAKATPEGYVERTRLQALKGSGFTWPSFADGRVFVRNLEEIASISVVQRSGGMPTVARGGPEHEFGRFIRKVEASTQKKALIDEFLKKHEQFPIIEDNYVHFVYRGEADDIAITGSMLDAGSAEAMERIEGTDFYHKTYQLEPGGRWEYRFNINFDEQVLDSLNPRSVPGWGDTGYSEVIPPGYEAASHLAEPAGTRRGTIESFTFTSEILGYDKEIKAYLPPGYDESDRAYPLLIVNNGLSWLDKGLMANSLDNLIGERVAPLVVVFLAQSPEWWLDVGDSGIDDYVRMQAEELVVHLEQKYRLIGEPGARALMGIWVYGLSTAYGALSYPNVFGKAAMQSPYLGPGAEDALVELVQSGKGSGVEFYLDWNRYEHRSVDWGYDVREESTRLAALLEENGHTLAGGEVLDSHGWGSWRSRTDRILEALFPAKPDSGP